MNSYNKIVDIIIAIIVLFIAPILFFSQKEDALSQTVVQTETKNFVNEVRSNGYLTWDQYQQFLSKLSQTGLTYDVGLEHKLHLLEPEYRLRTTEEVIEQQNNNYTGGNPYTYDPVTTQIPIVSDPINGSLNTETNESVLAGSSPTPANPDHVHTDDCYVGEKHIHTGNSRSGGGCYGKRTTASTYCGTFTGSTVYEYYATGSCNSCGRSYSLHTNHVPSSHTCYSCDGTVSYSYTTYVYHRCTGCSAMSTSYGGPHYRTTSVYTINCGKTEGVYYKGNEEADPICNQIVSNIEPTHQVQTVTIGDPLITTVTAAYMDGSTNVVVATTPFSTDSICQDQTVTLTYTNVVEGITYTNTCTISVNVIPRTNTCTHGHTYNLNSDGSDPGCPYCTAWLDTLEIITPSSGSITIYQGTTLAENGVTLLATYLDGRTEYLDHEYVDNLDNSYVGEQTVTISYKGKYATLTVVTKRKRVQCSKCGHYYELYPDGSDPGCPYCASATPIFTGDVMEYEDKRYQEEILAALEKNRIYYFLVKDYFTVSVGNRTKSTGASILSKIYHSQLDETVQSEYGGYIRKEGD